MTHAAPKADRAELRKFGLVMAAAFAILACLRWWIKSDLPEILFGISAVFFVFGVVLPMALGPVFRVWMKFAEVLNWVMTRILLTVVFFAAITPAAILYRLISGDPLKRKWESEATTYWEAPDDQPDDLEAYRNQF